MAETIQFFQQGLWLSVLMSAPPLLAATILGVTISLVQAVTQVQEQTLPYVIKLGAVAVTLALFGRWFGVELLKLCDMAFLLIPSVGR